MKKDLKQDWEKELIEKWNKGKWYENPDNLIPFVRQLLVKEKQKAIEEYAREVIPFKDKKWRERIEREIAKAEKIVWKDCVNHYEKKVRKWWEKEAKKELIDNLEKGR